MRKLQYNTDAATTMPLKAAWGVTTQDVLRCATICHASEAWQSKPIQYTVLSNSSRQQPWRRVTSGCGANVRVHSQRDELLAIVIYKFLPTGTDEASVAESSCTLKANQQSQYYSYGLHSLTVGWDARRCNADGPNDRAHAQMMRIKLE